ncbi:MAG: hypothetical protein FH762_20135 [Firmicutes bacterium]|nr:hypothetical protein [Bacillota bacterium]
MTIKAGLDNAIFRFVEHELYNYESTIEELKEIKNDIREESAGNITYGNESTTPPYPKSSSETAVIDLITNKAIMRATKTIRDIERAKEKLDGDKLKLFELKYKECMPWQQILGELCISDRTYFRWRSEIVRTVAKEMGFVI